MKKFFEVTMIASLAIAGCSKSGGDSSPPAPTPGTVVGTQTVAAGTTPQQTPPIVPPTGAATGAASGSPATGGASGTLNKIATAPATGTTTSKALGLQGFWMDAKATTYDQYSCKNFVDINEKLMQYAEGTYCWNGATPVIEVDYLGAITNETATEIDFTNSNVGCDSTAYAQPMTRPYTLSASTFTLTPKSGLINLGAEAMGHWANSPQISTLQVGCFNGSDAFQAFPSLQTSLNAMMVY